MKKAKALTSKDDVSDIRMCATCSSLINLDVFIYPISKAKGDEEGQGVDLERRREFYLKL